jgi:hypothetical protein
MRPVMASAAHTIDDHAHSGISPELVLVDPELSGRVRPRIPLLFRRRTPPLPVLHLVEKTNRAPSGMRQPAA